MGGVETSPNLLVPGVYAGWGLARGSLPLSEVNSSFSACRDLTLLFDPCCFAGLPLAVLCQLESIT